MMSGSINPLSMTPWEALSWATVPGLQNIKLARYLKPRHASRHRRLTTSTDTGTETGKTLVASMLTNGNNQHAWLASNTEHSVLLQLSSRLKQQLWQSAPDSLCYSNYMRMPPYMPYLVLRKIKCKISKEDTIFLESYICCNINLGFWSKACRLSYQKHVTLFTRHSRTIIFHHSGDPIKCNSTSYLVLVFFTFNFP